MSKNTLFCGEIKPCFDPDYCYDCVECMIDRQDYSQQDDDLYLFEEEYVECDLGDLCYY